MIGKQEIVAKNLQMEIDLTMEMKGVITIFEGKNGFPKDFAIYQIFHPYKYYCMLKEKNMLNIEQVTCCYVLRKQEDIQSLIRIYNYTFEDINNINSIKLLKSAQYNLVKR